MTRKKKKSILRFLPVVIVIIVIAWFWHSRPSYDLEPGYQSVERAFHEQQSNLMVEVTGTVVRILETNANRERYQEFVIRIENGQSVRVVNDMRYTDHIPLSINDNVTVRGDYLWSEGGGTIRYAHQDRSAQRRHGWIDHEGKRYK